MVFWHLYIDTICWFLESKSCCCCNHFRICIRHNLWILGPWICAGTDLAFSCSKCFFCSDLIFFRCQCEPFESFAQSEHRLVHWQHSRFSLLEEKKGLKKNSQYSRSKKLSPDYFNKSKVILCNMR